MSNFYKLFAWSILSIPLFSSAQSINDEGFNSIYIKNKDNTKLQISIDDELQTYFNNGNLIMNGNSGYLEFPVNSINYFYFSKDIKSEDNNTTNIFINSENTLNIRQTNNIISLDNINTETILYIYSIDGELIYKERVKERCDIYLSQLKKGVYILTIDNISFKFGKK